jgi:hypothetical protein
MKSRNISVMLIAVTIFLLCSFPLVTAAQSDADVASATVPTNIQGIRTFPVPPAGFDPRQASDLDLARYGFPPRPDQKADPDHYAMWERVMAAAKIRWNGELKALPGSGDFRVPGSTLSVEPAAVTAETVKKMSNVAASGVLLSNTLKKWSSKTSFSDIWTIISVPTAQIPFDSGSCFASGSADMIEVSFAGIGGYIFYSPATGLPLFAPMLQGGVYTEIDCAEGTNYYAYVGWGTYAAEFSVHPGDVFYTEVQASGPSAGSVYVEDLTTLTYNSYAVSGPTIAGNTAQWMVARPCCTNSGNLDGMYPLANTISISFDGATALNGNGAQFYPGSQATSTYILTMTDDAADQAIELVNQGTSGFQGQHSLFFQTTGCAYTGGCTP